MKQSRACLYAVCLSLLFVAGCAPGVRVPIVRPAEVSLAGIKSVAVADIEGSEGRALSDLLSQKLFESRYFEVLDRQFTRTLIREHNLDLSGAIDGRTSARFDKLLGSSALIFGRSHGQYRQVTEMGKPYDCKKDKKCREFRKIGQGRVETSLRVVDLETGRILAIKSYVDEASETTRDVDRWPYDVDEARLMAGILDKTARRFMRMIVPYTEYVYVKFADSDLPEMKAGIASAQSGQWVNAATRFQNAVNANQQDGDAWYNLGLALMYTNRFDEAVGAFTRSNVLKPSSRCAGQIASCERLRADREELEAQTQGR